MPRLLLAVALLSACKPPSKKQSEGEETPAPSSAPSAAEEAAEDAAPALARETAERRSQKAGVDWVRVPGGQLSMGSDEHDPDEAPAHQVTLGEFWMSRTEVTVGQYQACVSAGVCSVPNLGMLFTWGMGDELPLNGVSWEQARVFASWLGARLPSEAEWEYAARMGSEGAESVWMQGTASCRQAVMCEGPADSCDPGCGKERSVWPPCSKPEGNSPLGICDLHGNLGEWVEDTLSVNYEGAPSDGSARVDEKERYCVVRGGGWRSPAEGLRSTNRDSRPYDSVDHDVGFRIVRDWGSAASE